MRLHNLIRLNNRANKALDQTNETLTAPTRNWRHCAPQKDVWLKKNPSPQKHLGKTRQLLLAANRYGQVKTNNISRINNKKMKIIHLTFLVHLLWTTSIFSQTIIPAGQVSGSWTQSNSPYYIQGSIMIPNDSTLAISEGVEVIFQGSFKLLVLGRLLAMGSYNDSITFTCTDTAIGWRGIRFEGTTINNDSSKFYYCNIFHGKATGPNTQDKNGGGFYFNNFSKAIISNCTISECEATGGVGGGISILGNGPIIKFNKITNNVAAGRGGGIASQGFTTIINNYIAFNTAYTGGGGIIVWGNSVINNNTIANNFSADYGGGIFCALGGTIPTISNNIVSNNSATEGGGISFTGGAELTNNTIVFNQANNGGALYFRSGSDPSFTNCIIWNNEAVISGPQIFLNDETSDPNFYFCNIEGNTSSFGLNGNFYTGIYSNNINLNPLFTLPSAAAGYNFNSINSNFHLQSNSPSIDAGSPVATYPTKDLQGNPRIIGCIIDQGALENQDSSNAIPTITITAQGPITFCQGNSVILTSSSISGNTWSNGSTTQSITVTNSGTYYTTISYGSCLFTSNLISVTTTSVQQQPTLACYETATFNNTTCQWDVTGTQPIQPTTACYETANFNPTSCSWVVSGTQPAAPTGLACYETATFNTTSCSWVVSGTQPAAPTGLACYETATFNTTSCSWVVSGTQPAAPTGLACYETANFNTTTCSWVVTGTQPTQPTGLACYETPTFNSTTCQWDVSGTQPIISQPTNQTVNINNNGQFVVASSDPSATYQWQSDLGVGFQNLNSVGQYIGTTNDTLTVSNLTMSNNNQPFRCIVFSGSCSDTSNVAILSVNDIVGINEPSQEKLFLVFPNPASTHITIDYGNFNAMSGYTLKIVNSVGQTVFTTPINLQTSYIDLSTWTGNGIYFVQLIDPQNNTSENRKIVIQ